MEDQPRGGDLGDLSVVAVVVVVEEGPDGFGDGDEGGDGVDVDGDATGCGEASVVPFDARD